MTAECNITACTTVEVDIVVFCVTTRCSLEVAFHTLYGIYCLPLHRRSGLFPWRWNAYFLI